MGTANQPTVLTGGEEADENMGGEEMNLDYSFTLMRFPKRVSFGAITVIFWVIGTLFNGYKLLGRKQKAK